jgi:hypothetical protein
MTKNLKSIIFSEDINNIFLKYSWFQNQSNIQNYDFCFKGEVADYYLKLDISDELINFVYFFDFQLSENKTYDMYEIINYINKISETGYFFYDSLDKKIKFKSIQNLSEKKPTKNSLIYFFDNHLSQTNSLFHKFAVAIHNLVYGERMEQNVFELLFLNIEGNA